MPLRSPSADLESGAGSKREAPGSAEAAPGAEDERSFVAFDAARSGHTVVPLLLRCLQ